MMQAAEPWHGYDFAVRLGIRRRHPARRRFFFQREMSSVLVIVTDVLGHQPFQMAFVEHDHMVEQVSSTIPDPAFGDAVLPRASEAGSFGLDAEVLDGADDFLVEVLCPVKDQIFRSRIVGKGLAQLLHHPSTGRMLSDIAVQNPPPVMRDHKEAVQQNVSVGTVKKSIAAIASRWLLRNAAHRFAGSGFRGAFRIQRNTVRSEMSKPRIFNSP